jgi:hypothetical protein
VRNGSPSEVPSITTDIRWLMEKSGFVTLVGLEKPGSARSTLTL